MRQEMKRLLIVFAAAAASSCMKMDYSERTDWLPIYVEGTVTSEDMLPLKHIRVTVGLEGETSSSTVYTSAKGIFRADVSHMVELEFPIVMTIDIDDIDGEKNGGLFAPVSDKITLFSEDIQDKPVVRINLAYRLTHATASESSRQAL